MVTKMARRDIKYLNGLAIVSIVFIALTIIPIGVFAGIIFSNGGFMTQEYSVEPYSYSLFQIDNDGQILFAYEKHGDSSDYDIYILSFDSYYFWDKENVSTIDDFEYHFDSFQAYKFMDEAYSSSYYVVVFNNANGTLDIQMYAFTTHKAIMITVGTLGIILAFFTAIMVLLTLAYFIKYLIIWPITGSGKPYDYRSNGYDRRDRDKRVRTKDRYYKYSPPSDEKTVSKKEGSVTGAPVAPAAPSRPRPPVRPRHRYESKPLLPAIENISPNYVSASGRKEYSTRRPRFLKWVEKTWDQTYLAERVLSVIALFFFILGFVVMNWFLIAALPLTLVGISIIVFFASRNRRDKVIRMVKGNKAIYLRDIARLINTSTEFVRSDAWKIINLGLAPYAFDVERGILFDYTQVDPSKIKKSKPVEREVTVQEDKPEEKPITTVEKEKAPSKKDFNAVIGPSEEILCPFCDAKNPADSSFCIKCGASMKPAK